ncbi:hypothetical protein CIHG_07101 [Coccidioides immitis H538.4]|uniref:DUF7719 domain-containing protein n=1 Tax=Coccidioides immitis H538.4 TaxID=396776 RepID=A0A0J8UNV0_COCIT|nr:hypothetical protein CIHG_07101 [Coccidioides immitis H538.4]
MPPRNRKERRAVSASSAATGNFDPVSIPMARPSTRGPLSQKTLLEIATEREATGKGGTEFIHVSSSGEIIGTENLIDSSRSFGRPAQRYESDEISEASEDDAAIPPFADTIFLSLPLSTVYFTLSFLAAHQYAQEIPYKKLIRDSIFVAFPILTFLIHFAHGHIISFKQVNIFGNKTELDGTAADSSAATRPISLKSLFPLTTRNIIFCILAIISGMRLIAMANEGSYYAVMKNTPPIGTIWVWCVFELSLGFAVLGLLIPVVWAVGLKGYSMI